MAAHDDQKQKIRKKANKVLFSTVFGTVLPVIIGTTILGLFSRLGDFASFINDGTFCLFSASLFTSAIYIMDGHTDLIREKLDEVLHQISKPLWIIIATVFALLFAKEKLDITIDVNKWFLWIVSIVAFIISVITLYRALLLEYKSKPIDVDPEMDSKEAVNSIMDNLD